jgi:hypothetical protein
MLRLSAIALCAAALGCGIGAVVAVSFSHVVFGGLLAGALIACTLAGITIAIGIRREQAEHEEKMVQASREASRARAAATVTTPLISRPTSRSIESGDPLNFD